MAELTISADDIQSAIEEYVDSFTSDTSREEVGTVLDAGDGIAHSRGFAVGDDPGAARVPGRCPRCRPQPRRASVGTVILGDFEKIEQGQQVKRTGEVLSVPVGDAFLGGWSTPRPADRRGRGDIDAEKRRALELQAPSVVERAEREGAAADRDQGHRRDDTDRPWPASS